MGFPRIIYGTNLDRVVDFDIPAFLPSGPSTADNIGVLPAGSGAKEYLKTWRRRNIDLVFRNMSPALADQVAMFRDYQQQNPGTAFTVELDRDLGGHHSFHHTLDDNDGVAGTWTRSSVAYAVNPVTGLFTSHATNTPRYVAGRAAGRSAIFMEAARTNLITYPNDLSDASWTKSSITISTNTTEVLDPNGGNIADKMTTTSASNSILFDTSTAISTDSGAYSVWLRTNGVDRDGTIFIGSFSGGYQQKNITVTGQWQLFEMAYISAGSDPNDWQFALSFDDNSAVIYHYSSMGEVGSTTKNASTIPDPTAAGSTATRSADKLLIPTTNLNRDKGSFGMWIKPVFNYDEHPGTTLFHSGVDASQRHISLDISSAGLFFYRVYLNNSTSSYVEINPSASGLTKDTWHHVVGVYDSTVANGMRLYLDGALIGGPSVNDSFPASSTGTNMGVGCFNTGLNPWFGAIQDFFYTSDVWTATQVSAAYNSPSGFGLNRLSAVLRDFNFPITTQNGNRWSTTIPCEEVIT